MSAGSYTPGPGASQSMPPVWSLPQSPMLAPAAPAQGQGQNMQQYFQKMHESMNNMNQSLGQMEQAQGISSPGGGMGFGKSGGGLLGGMFNGPAYMQSGTPQQYGWSAAQNNFAQSGQNPGQMML